MVAGSSPARPTHIRAAQGQLSSILQQFDCWSCPHFAHGHRYIQCGQATHAFAASPPPPLGCRGQIPRRRSRLAALHPYPPRRRCPTSGSGRTHVQSTALTTARRGTVFLSLVCFAISYIALADLTRIAGLGPEAYLWPVMIDGTIAIGTAAVVGLGGDRTAWSLLAASALVSIAGNGIHAGLTQGSWIAVGVALTPPVFLLWVTHLTVRLGREGGEHIDNSDELPEPVVAVADPRTRSLELIDEGGVSLREIARQLGTNDRTVWRWRDARESIPSA
ncbi:helix-turn-helix domain-containing protein [Rhodococcoides fascians]|uniref:helix-turn-helix domain-containing protein n=1 Tax=Rhodococcoides fascians TaxID=1828 RepID=UPI00389AA7D3